MASILNTRLFGAEWVNDYTHPFNPRRTNLLRSFQNANGFCQSLSGTRRFFYGDQWAWDQDLEQNFSGTGGGSTLQPFGDDTSYAEKVDLFFFTGHGTQDGLLYGVPYHDNGEARYDEMELGQGGVLKWLVVDACKVLEATGVIFRWGRIFKGLRYMLGFHGECRDVADRGTRFAQHLNPQGGSTSGETLWRAWELAGLETEAAADLSCACLRAGNAQSVLQNDRWTDASLPADTSSLPTDFVYLRHIPVSNS